MLIKKINVTISKELFCKVISDVERNYRYQEGLNDFFRKNAADGYLFQPDCSDTVMILLHELLEDKDQDDIGYFCFELDFGKKYKKGCFKVGKKDIDISSAEKLYDYLVGSDYGTDEESEEPPAKETGGDES